ncbi:MAG TPA: hypothetical protein VEY70_00490 [Metabacillus sp.]|nr:hypothetical protein [Metabacillus sp.]
MKWRNYGLWTSIASLLYMVFKDLGLQIDLTSWETYVTSILGILVTLGIISNPESGRGYFNAKTPTQSSDQSMNNQQLQQQNSVSNEMNSEISTDENTPDRQYTPYEK